MHLLIETSDDKIVKTRISPNKSNDNSSTWAFTLGEQLDKEDFTNGNDIYSDFMLKWLKRALQEEYKTKPETYDTVVNEDSFRILSLDFEVDRYNFALLCTVRLNYTFDEFKNKIAPFLSQDEAVEIGEIELKDIPDILLTYVTGAKEQYHPSSYLRLLVFYCHKLSFGRAENVIEERVKKSKKRT